MKKSMAALIALIVGVVAVLGTYFVMDAIYKNEEQSGSKYQNAQQEDDEASDSQQVLDYSEFDFVEETLLKNYLYDFDMGKVQNAGLKAMVASLEDPYSVYLTPEEFQAFTQDMTGEYYGVGMIISMDEETDFARVEHFFDGSPAKEAGLKVGDLIIRIDDEDVTEKTLEEISMLCIGEEGAPIKMTVMRGSETLTVDMVRRAIQMDMLAYEMLEDDIGYMQIYQFGGNSSVLFAEAMGTFVEQNAKGVVIDLRNNPGGYMGAVTEMLDLLLPQGTLVYTEDKNKKRVTETSDASCIDIPVTLIVNGNTASAAEIFAGAVQDFDYGEVVGTTTYGKGVVQMVLPGDSGSALKITISEYFTPKGRSINGNGIYPDYYVELSDDYVQNPLRENDMQLSKAIEVLKQSIARTQ